MELNDYMHESSSTAIYPNALPEGCDSNLVGLFYCTVKLGGEVGEVQEHIGKALRDDAGKFTPERLRLIKGEIGDVMWYMCQICRNLGIDPNEVLNSNLNKLQSRKERGVLNGSGSDR